MLRRVPNNRDQDKSHKRLANLGRLNNIINAAHKIIRAHGDDDRRHDEDYRGGDGAHAGLLGLDVGAALGDGRVGALAVEEVVVGAQLEEEVEDVEEQEDDGRAAREEEDRVAGIRLYALLLAVEDVVELGAALADCSKNRGEWKGWGEEAYSRGDDQRGGGQREERARRLGGARRELLLHAAAVGVPDVPDPAEEEAHAENEKQVREDGAEHRGLHDLDLAVVEGDDADLYRGFV